MKQIYGKIGTLLRFAALVWAVTNSNSWTSTASTTSAPDESGAMNGRTPNILFIIMDDVGIDQLRVFGYGGIDVPKTPNLDAIAHAGVRFRNVWAMPECSPSRAIFFEGRFPLRTNVLAALLPDDLANSQVSPFEVTTPKLLRTRNYESGNFGKFHLAQAFNNPFNDRIVQSLGWDYFDGFLEAAPYPIDQTAGGVSPSGAYTCGFVPNAVAGGADTGSCHFADNTCVGVSANLAHPTPGRYCLEQGGIFVPNATCQQAPPNLNFNQENGFYVWHRVINYPDGRVEQVPLTDPRARGYLGEATTSSAVSWINGEKKAHKSWMATVAFSQIHTPYQQAPTSLLAPGFINLSNLKCTGNLANNLGAYHLLSNQMLEGMDTEIGRILVQTGLATYNSDGTLNYQPEKTDAMVVIVGDNGTYAGGVKFPFDPNRAKGFVYQTGVWVPLMVSGPLVNSPDRDVDSMVSIADIFQLFGEIAGLDVHKEVPKSHILDSVSMLPYLTNPTQASIRQTNFTQTANNIHTTPPPPCVVQLTTPPTCFQIVTTKRTCEYEGGDWYGPGAAQQYASCGDVKNANLYPNGLNILPDSQQAIRNDKYKLVQKAEPDCTAGPNCPDVTLTEFYEIDEAVPTPTLDKDGTALCADTLDPHVVNCPQGLTQEQLANFNSLLADLNKLLSSEASCPGDGNEDKIVDGLDLHFWEMFDGRGSSWYDFNFDGQTDAADRAIIEANLGTRCRPKP
jgi:hypothetical protein